LKTVTKLPDALEQFDWRRTSWEGARREQMRRWAELPLDRIVAALEEMEELANALAVGTARKVPK
jgi:hypothetical protein